MQKSFKKAIASFLVVLMLLTSVPLNGFVGMDWSAFAASAAEENIISSLKDMMSEKNEGNFLDFPNKFEEDKADFSEFAEKVKDEAENVFSLMAEKKVEQTQPVAKFSLKRSVVPASEETDFSWDYDEETHTLTVRGTGDMPDYTEMLEQEGVPTPIAPWAEYAKEIEKVVIEAGITSVGDCAFALCTNLKEVVLPEGITSIGAGAFAYCVELVDINLPSTLISVDQMAFGMCWSVKELVLPDSIETIGDMAFMYMFDLEKINLPASLQDNGEGMFTYALSLKELVVPEGLKIEAVYDVSEFFALSLEHITNHSATFTVDMSFADMLGGYFDSVEYADAYCHLYKNYFKYEFTGEETATLGIEVSEQELIEDTINYFNTTLGTNYAVADFESFEHVLAISEEVFASHLIETSGYPSYFSVSCLENSKQHELCRDNAISHNIIGQDKKCICFAMSGTIGDNITWSVDGETKTLIFDGSGEMSDFDDVPEYVKYSVYIENISFAEGSAITSIGAYAFYGLTNVEEITLSEGIETLGEACFYNSGLKILNIPASLTNVDVMAFYMGTAPLEEINVADENEKFLSYEGSLYSEYVEYDDEMTYVLYKQPEKNAGVFIDNTIGIFYCAFENYSTVTEITVPDTVLIMTEGAFLTCSSLETINIGNSKIYEADGETASLEIDEDFVVECNNLTAINVDERNVNYASSGGILYDKNLEFIITVPTGLAEVSVPETVINIQRYTLDYAKLQKVTILNPDCAIWDEAGIINRSATICGHKDSTAEAYADKYNRNFEYIGDVTVADVEFDFSEVKKVYGQFSDIDTSGIKVTLTFSDGTTSVKTAGFNVSGFDSDEKGEQTVTVTYRSYSDTYTVTIAEPFFSYVGEFIDFTIEPGEVVYIGYTPNETQPLSLTFRSGTNVEYYVTVYEADKQTVIYEGVFDYQIPSYQYESGKTYYFALSHNRAEYGAYIGVELSLAHNYYVSSSSEATCTEAGYITYTCSDCGNSYTENTYALGHKDENADNICDTCEKEFIYISVGETKNIEVGEAETVHIKFVPEESGSYRFYSSGDGDTYGYLYDENMNQLRTDDQSGENSNFSIVYDFEVGKTYWLGAKYYYSYNSGSFDVTLECAHDGEWEVVTEATCEEDGLKKCICTQCGKEVTGEIERLYHNMTVISSTSATCTEQGTLVYDCTRCDYSYTSYITPYHTDSDGNRICEVCGKISTYEVEFNVPESITLDTDYETLYAEFTPTFSGYYRLSSQLNDSNYHYVYFNVYKNGSYISSGYGYEGISCYLDQGETYTIHITGNKCTFDVLISCAHQGEWSVTTEPTCIEDGLEKRICTQCGDEETRAINRLWHSCEVISITPETCTEYGEEIYKCIRCDYGYTNLLDAHHTDDDDNGICEVCDKKITYILELEKTESITLDTSKEILYAKFTPEINGNYNFGATFNENEDQNVSFYVTDSNSYYVNSGNGGYGGIECYLNAGETYTVKINGYGGSGDGNSGTFDMLVSCCHDGEWIITKQPTCTENGEKERVCTKCGETETEVEWCLGHDYVRTTTKEPTCTEKGIETITCSRCTDVHEENEINKSIHTDDNNDYICEVCNNEIPHIIVGETKSLEVAEAELVYVKFIPTTSGLYRFYANASNDTYAYLYDADLNQISYDDDSGEDRNFLIEYDGFEAGEVYYFGVRYYYSYDSGAFDITLECGHIYSEEWTVDVEPTCTDEGSKSHHCTRCDEKNDITAVEPLGHNYGDWVITTEPTCIKTGVEKRNCSRCTDIESQAVDALGHNYSTEWTIDKEATCTIDGSKSHHCTRCEDKTDVTVIDAHGHTWGNWSVTTEPTCTEKGEETRTCSVCKDTEKQDVSALGHDYSEEWTVDQEATCTEDGSKSHHCSRCDDKSDVTVIEKLGHAYSEWVVTIEPTCTKTGVEKRTCSRCGNVESQVVDALGHDYSEEWTVDKEATCTEDGSKSHHCTRCDDKTDVTVIEAHGHEYESVITEPTCTKDGYTTHTCSICEDTYTDTVVDALGHTYSEWVVTTEPSCTKKGVEKRTCSRCDNVESQTVDALGHDYSKEWTIDKEATCTEDGSKSHHCIRCDDKADVTVIEKLGHAYGEWVVTTEPTCIKTGVEKRTCSRCDNVESQTVEALGHDYSEEWTVDKESTCTEDGSKSHHCARCDDKADITVIKAAGHSYESVITNPSCTEKGYTTHTCSVCGSGYTDSFVEATGHSTTVWTVVKEATCTKDGKEESVCDTCGTIVTRTKEKLGHNYGEWTTEKEATVLAEGVKIRACDKCGNREEETIEKVYINIEENTEYGLANFTVVNAQTLEPIEGASIFISTENDGENTIFTDAEGKVSIILPVGKQNVSAYAKDCLTRNLTVNVKSGENDIPKIGLSSKNTYDVELTHERMTYEEIVEAGIDVNDPDNQHMYKYELRLEFVPEIDWVSFFYYMNGAGQIIGGGSGGSGGSGGGGAGGWVSGSGSGGTGGYYYRPATDTEESITVYPVSEYFYLIIRGEVKWLKEMFDVEMLVINNSMTDTLEDLSATLTLPDGLSLADMVEGEQTLTQEIENIAEGESKSVHWYVRGDKAGSYSIEALLEGMVMPFEEEIYDVFVADKKLQVWAGDALHLHFEFPNAAYYGEDYPVTITLTNVSDITLYNITHRITYIEQGRVTYYSDGSVDEEVYMAESDASWYKFVPEFKPGDKIVIELGINIMFESKLIEYQIEQMIKQVDAAEQFVNGFKAVMAGLNAANTLVNVITGCSVAIGSFLGADDYASIAGNKANLFKALHSKISSLDKYMTSGNKTFDAAAKLANTGLSATLNAITEDPETWLRNSSYNDVKKVLEDVEALEKSLIPQATAEEVANFNIFDSIRTLISALPVKFTLARVLYNDNYEENTTTIPWSYSVTSAGPQYFGVSNMSSYLNNLGKAVMAEIYEEAVPSYVQLIPGLDDPLNYDDVKREIIAVEHEIEQFKAKDATGKVTFKAYYVENQKSRLRTLVGNEGYTLECDNETAVFEDGVLTFTGNGIISLTPANTNGGTLYIEDSEGNTYTYDITVVEQHECKANEEQRVIISPTAEYDGFAVKCCETCEDVLEIINLSVSDCEEHSFSAWTTESEANCTVGGVATRTCSSCGYEETSFIDATGHTEKTINKVDATCTADGYTGDVICEVCEETISVGEAVEANGHSYEAVITAPTCTVDGYTTNTCSVCQDSYISDKTEKLGHSGGTANCEDKAICTVCGEAYGEINPDNHKNVVTDKAVSATCTSTGLTEGSHCDACSKVIVAQTTIAKISHKEMIIPAVNATCSKTGLTEGKKCSVCGEILVKQTETSKLEHSYKSVVTAPTCTNDGYTTYTCSVCKDTYKANETAKLGHSMSGFIVVEQPSCTENGLEIAECSRCDYSEVNELSASGHNYQDGVCTECGDSKSNNCSCNCHKTGFMGFIWKILRFFYKLFGMNKVCSCGVAHY